MEKIRGQMIKVGEKLFFWIEGDNLNLPARAFLEDAGYTTVYLRPLDPCASAEDMAKQTLAEESRLKGNLQFDTSTAFPPPDITVRGWASLTREGNFSVVFGPTLDRPNLPRLSDDVAGCLIDLGYTNENQDPEAFGKVTSRRPQSITTFRDLISQELYEIQTYAQSYNFEKEKASFEIYADATVRLAE